MHPKPGRPGRVLRPESPREWLARQFFSLLIRLVTPLYFVKLWRRGRAEPLYRQFWAERLALSAAAEPDALGAVWVHAVSLGETRAAEALVRELRRLNPAMRLLLTHSTATGREAGKALLRAGDRQAWLPFDTPGAVRRFLRRHRPAIGVLMETEIWPNLLWAAERAGVPMVLANARLSERSARRGHRLAALLGPAVERIALALAQTRADAERLRDTGLARVEVCGNLKFDLQPAANLLAQGQAWRLRLNRAQGLRSVILAAVTREGEETLLLDAWTALREQFASQNHAPLLVVVPRHPQRFDEVAALVEARGLSLARRSSWKTVEGDAPSQSACAAEVWLGDSMREMPLYYAMADLALLGGSFAPLGGQNLIEAAACACPVLMGPHTFNFAEAARLAEQSGAAQRVADLAEALQRARALLDDPVTLALARQHAEAFAAAHRGAGERMARAIQGVLLARG
ncbi:MAG: 3-deoxy-D-manno-octulosonic acid transferase [Pelomonas sp.]|nr:3-deoxy-D-manno-octulosonic acid transferase [Roseateles sp.]MBV8470555.1 3-deoxy-D-manno-octulosonic acid transferase [Burkholderiaceae bacterium]MBV8604593.1 3-deoxy-D-manno-octulosonic acid transferase [Roseateles sp.]